MSLIKAEKIDFDKEMEKHDAKRAVTVYIQREKSEVVALRANADFERRQFQGNDGKYTKIAVPVVHEEQDKFLELFFNEAVDFVAKARAGDGRVTVSRDASGKHSFT